MRTQELMDADAERRKWQARYEEAVFKGWSHWPEYFAKLRETAADRFVAEKRRIADVCKC